MCLFTETWLEKTSIFDEFNTARQDRLKEVAKRVHASFLIQDMSTTNYALDFLFSAFMDGTTISDDQLQTTEEYRILENIYNLIQNEKRSLTKKLKADIRKLANPGFILKKIQSQMCVCGLIASELRWRYPDLVIGIWQRWKQRFYCELRRGRDCDVNLASLVERIKGEVELTTGGGHPAAAAFTAEGDNFFKALDKLRHHITEGA